jgi:hypothetical protein
MNAILTEEINSMTRILKKFFKQKSTKLISDPMLLVLLPQILLKGVSEQKLMIGKKIISNYPKFFELNTGLSNLKKYVYSNFYFLERYCQHCILFKLRMHVISMI